MKKNELTLYIERYESRLQINQKTVFYFNNRKPFQISKTLRYVAFGVAQTLKELGLEFQITKYIDDPQSFENNLRLMNLRIEDL